MAKPQTDIFYFLTKLSYGYMFAESNYITTPDERNSSLIATPKFFIQITESVAQLSSKST